MRPLPYPGCTGLGSGEARPLASFDPVDNRHAPPFRCCGDVEGAAWPLEAELDEARRELARARHALLMHERADLEGRVVNRGVWRHTLRKAQEQVDDLRAVVADLERRAAA